MFRHKLFYVIVMVLVTALSFSGFVSAASGASIAFLDSNQQPEYSVTASNLVNDGGGCDIVAMMMRDATGQITDIDEFCIDLVTGIGTDYTDFGSYATGYYATQMPIKYTVFDIGNSNACTADENSIACGDLLLSGEVSVIGEAYYPVGGHVSGCSLAVPEGSVVGEAPLGAQVYYEPGNVAPGVVLNAGTYIVVGQDKSEIYYKVMLACQFVWVRKDTIQPSFQAPQNGTPLPTRVVS